VTTIIDLDNCIADDAWRIPRIQWQHSDPDRRYHDYHLLAAFDSCANHDLFEGNDNVVILTARPILFKAATEEWLRRNGVRYKHLIMRNNDDHSHSKDLKRAQLGWMRSHYGVPWSFIAAAYDDREDVVEMYRELGIPGHVRRIHDVCAYTPPKK